MQAASRKISGLFCFPLSNTHGANIRARARVQHVSCQLAGSQQGIRWADGLD